MKNVKWLLILLITFGCKPEKYNYIDEETYHNCQDDTWVGYDEFWQDYLLDNEYYTETSTRVIGGESWFTTMVKYKFLDNHKLIIDYKDNEGLHFIDTSNWSIKDNIIQVNFPKGYYYEIIDYGKQDFRKTDKDFLTIFWDNRLNEETRKMGDTPYLLSNWVRNRLTEMPENKVLIYASEIKRKRNLHEKLYH